MTKKNYKVYFEKIDTVCIEIKDAEDYSEAENLAEQELEEKEDNNTLPPIEEGCWAHTNTDEEK
jgi:hypothetical protein